MIIKMDDKEFYSHTGYRPEHDDLDRVNCEEVGEIGHSRCGWCTFHNLPRFQCGCRVKITRAGESS